MNHDDAGMGKSFQATEAGARPFLISTRGYATDQWARFLAAQYPMCAGSILDVTTARQHDDRQFLLSANIRGGPPDFTIINFEMLRNYTFDPRRYETV